MDFMIVKSLIILSSKKFGVKFYVINHHNVLADAEVLIVNRRIINAALIHEIAAH
jgi:hypothetical protein